MHASIIGVGPTIQFAIRNDSMVHARNQRNQKLTEMIVTSLYYYIIITFKS